MRIKNVFLFLLLCSAHFAKIDTMHEEHERVLVFQEHLLKVLQEEKEAAKRLEISYPAHVDCEIYEREINNCHHSRPLEKKILHPRDNPCPRCKAAYNDADKLTQKLIEQKCLVNEIEYVLAGIGEHCRK